MVVMWSMVIIIRFVFAFFKVFFFRFCFWFFFLLLRKKCSYFTGEAIKEHCEHEFELVVIVLAAEKPKGTHKNVNVTRGQNSGVGGIVAPYRQTQMVVNTLTWQRMLVTRERRGTCCSVRKGQRPLSRRNHKSSPRSLKRIYTELSSFLSEGVVCLQQNFCHDEGWTEDNMHPSLGSSEWSSCHRCKYLCWGSVCVSDWRCCVSVLNTFFTVSLAPSTVGLIYAQLPRIYVQSRVLAQRCLMVVHPLAPSTVDLIYARHPCICAQSRVMRIVERCTCRESYAATRPPISISSMGWPTQQIIVLRCTRSRT